MRPTFIGIGSARCGSTWLHRSLGLHPDIQVSTPKQICYFNQMIRTRSLEWYWSHFEPDPDCPSAPIRGEVTPFYARLSRHSVDSVLHLLPDVRVLLSIRNPVERCWSGACLDLGHYGGRTLPGIPTSALYRYFQRQRVIRYADYEQIISRWSSRGRSSRLHVLLFDELQQDPIRVLEPVLKHLGASSNWRPPAGELRKVVRPEGPDQERWSMPESVRWYLSRQWLEPTRRLNRHLDGRVQGWVDSMESVVGRSTTSWRLQRAFTRFVGCVPEAVAYRAYDQLNEWSLRRAWRRIGG